MTVGDVSDLHRDTAVCQQWAWHLDLFLLFVSCGAWDEPNVSSIKGQCSTIKLHP